MRKVAVLGAGTMGAGIAQTAAQSGCEVVLHDVSDAQLAKGIASVERGLSKLAEKGRLAAPVGDVLDRVRVTTELTALGECPIVIEAVPEDLALKRRVFGQLEAVTSAETVLATNTSSIPVTAIAGELQHPERVVGMHFFNPVPLMQLVEIIPGLATAEAAVEAAVAMAELLGKTVVVCQDAPGFLVNRVARGYYGEALRLLQEGVADVETIDRLARSEANFRMGPFELMDLIGIDVNLAVSQGVYRASYEEARYKPSGLQERMVQGGLLGRKTGKGFYRYDE